MGMSVWTRLALYFLVTQLIYFVMGLYFETGDKEEKTNTSIPREPGHQRFDGEFDSEIIADIGLVHTDMVTVSVQYCTS